MTRGGTNATSDRSKPRDRRLSRVLNDRALREDERSMLVAALSESSALRITYSMRRELMALWEPSLLSREEVVGRLQDWCGRAEEIGVPPLVESSRRLRSLV